MIEIVLYTVFENLQKMSNFCGKNLFKWEKDCNVNILARKSKHFYRGKKRFFKSDFQKLNKRKRQHQKTFLIFQMLSQTWIPD